MASGKRIVGLADCNNFFVSCERSVDRSLEGKAVVVLSNNDGCVVARSNESKLMGVKMGQPAFELKDEIRSGRLIALSGNHLLYREISLRVHEIFRRYVPDTIDYSIDEAFLDMSGIPERELKSIGDEICRESMSQLHIPLTIGFSYSKTLSKLATERGKKSGDQTVLLTDETEIWRVMESLPISELWGVGRRLTKRLYENGVYTIADFARRELLWIRGKLGVNGERSWRELHGESCIELEHVKKLLQDSVSESRTFPEDVDDYDYIRARIMRYSGDCAGKLRAMKGLCRSVTVILRGNPFKSGAGYERPEGRIEMRCPTSDTAEITAAALRVLDNIYVEGMLIKRAGVVLGDIVADVGQTPSLFEEPREDEKLRRRLMRAIDGINGLVGSGRVCLASQLTSGHPGHNDGYSSSFGAPFDPKLKK